MGLTFEWRQFPRVKAEGLIMCLRVKTSTGCGGISWYMQRFCFFGFGLSLLELLD
jgi:hypothetical protein